MKKVKATSLGLDKQILANLDEEELTQIIGGQHETDEEQGEDTIPIKTGTCMLTVQTTA